MECANYYNNANNDYGFMNDRLGCGEDINMEMSNSISNGSSFITVPFDRQSCGCGVFNLAPLDRSCRWTTTDIGQYPPRNTGHCDAYGHFLHSQIESEDSQFLYSDVEVTEYDDIITEPCGSDTSWLTPLLTIVNSNGNYLVRNPRHSRLDNLNHCIYYQMRDHPC